MHLAVLIHAYDSPGATELLKAVSGQGADARGQGLPEGEGVSEGRGVEGVVDLLGGGLAVALKDDLGQLCLVVVVVIGATDGGMQGTARVQGWASVKKRKK